MNMGESWSIILLLIPLIAGAIAVFFSFQLMKRFRESYTNSYFYYVVFLYIFGVYSLAGSGILQYALIRMEVNQEVIRAAGFYTLLLGVPFLFLSKFMLYKFLAELSGTRLSPVFTTSYFLVGITLFVAYGIMIVRLNRFQLGEYELLVTLHRIAFISIMSLIYLPLFLWGWILSKRSKGQEQKKFIRVLTSWYLLYMAFTTLSFGLIPVHPVIPYVFLFLFLSWHLVPILFINLFLERNHPPSSLQQDFETRLDSFVTTYEISPRETEVIRLICRGMSNQDISDELFISLQTVKDHVHRIFLKTGVKNRVQLTNLIRTK
jgi:DNA-binding CsgD family transcriptional regulator